MLSYVAIMSPFVREDFPTPAEQAIMRRSRPMASSSFNLCFLCPRALTWSSFLLSGMFATKSLLFNDLLASVASTAHIYAHIPVYFGELIYIVFWCFCFHVSHYFVFFSHYYIHGYSDQTLVADLMSEIDTTISDHIVGASKSAQKNSVSAAFLSQPAVTSKMWPPPRVKELCL
jgi:hypothetical protein